MLNNGISKIKMQSSKVKTARHNLSHDVSTSYSFGEVQPSLCLEMFAESKAVLSKEHLVRPDPVVAPTFGRLVCKNHTRFVPMQKIWPAYADTLAQTPFSYAGVTRTPSQLPTITLGLLSLMCLVGAKITMYEATTSGAVISYKAPKVGSSEANNLLQWISNWYGGNSWYNHSVDTNYWKFSYNTFNISTAVLLGDVYGNSVNDYPDFYGRIPFANGSGFAAADGSGVEVPIGAEDYLIERTFDGHTVAFAVKLSAFGKRIRKIMIGLGYQINFGSKVEFSILPLFAWYSAYFDTYHSKQWVNFSDTWCSKLQGLLLTNLNYLTPSNPYRASLDFLFGPVVQTGITSVWCGFVKELGDCWYSQEMDYIAAHTQNIANSVHNLEVSSFLDVGSSLGTVAPASAAVSGTVGMSVANVGDNPHSFIYRLQHSELDSKLLQRMSRFVNRDSVIGQEVTKQLEALGFGEWLKANPSYYVGNYDFPVRFSEVSAQSDTYDIGASGTGAVLGEYGGKALGYGESDTMRFSTREPGYLITLSSVVPLAGYSEGVDLRLLGKDKYSCFNPEFECLGVEASPKLAVVGEQRHIVADAWTNGSLDDNFGYISRYTRFKVMPNRMNGDFSLHSTRNSYLPYTLDKVINVNELQDVKLVGAVGNYFAYSARRSFAPKDLPHADVLWQYPTKYGYLANFERIFALVGDVSKNPENWLNSEEFYYTYQGVDEFKSHIIVNLQFYARMLPIEETYGTDLDDSGKFDMVAEKQ